MSNKENNKYINISQLSPNSISAIKNCIAINNTFLSKLMYNTYNAKECLYTKHSAGDYKNFCNWLGKIIEKNDDSDFFGITIAKMYKNNSEEYLISTPSRAYAYFVISTLRKCEKTDYNDIYDCIYTGLGGIDFIAKQYEDTEDIKAFYLMLESEFHLSIFEKMFHYINDLKLTYNQDVRDEFMKLFGTTLSNLLQECLKNDALEIIIAEELTWYEKAFENLRCTDCFSFYNFSIWNKSFKEVMSHSENETIVVDDDSGSIKRKIKVFSPHAILRKLFNRINTELEIYNKGQDKILTLKYDEEKVIKTLEKQLFLSHCKVLTSYIVANPYIDFCCRCIDYGISINTDSMFAHLKTETDYSLACIKLRDLYDEQKDEKVRPKTTIQNAEIVAPTIHTNPNFSRFIHVVLESIKMHHYDFSLTCFLKHTDFNSIVNCFHSSY